jgi:hypothetical protein
MPERKATVRVGDVFVKRAYGAGVLPTSGLDLDYVGAQVSHQLAAELAFFVGQF